MLTHPVTQVLWEEVQLAESQGFEGVAFDDPYSIRNAIWVSYILAGGRMGQEQQYPQPLWRDLEMVFQLLEYLCTSAGYPSMVQRRFEQWPHHCYRTDLVMMIDGRDVHPDRIGFIERCLWCANDVITRLNGLLESPVSQEHAAYKTFSVQEGGHEGDPRQQNLSFKTDSQTINDMTAAYNKLDHALEANQEQQREAGRRVMREQWERK